MVHFHSDATNNDWGYKMTITPRKDLLTTLPTQQHVLESRHPYLDGTDEYNVVEIPGAVGYTVSFDPKTCTEANHDFVR